MARGREAAGGPAPPRTHFVHWTGRPAKATRFVGGQTLILTDDPDDNTVGT